MRYFMLGLLLMLACASCAHKIIGKNCESTNDSGYYICDSLNILGK